MSGRNLGRLDRETAHGLVSPGNVAFAAEAGYDEAGLGSYDE